MLEQEDYEYLKNLPHLNLTPSIVDLIKVWYASDETLISVARILNSLDLFTSQNDVINFFESPHKWTRDIRDLITKYEPSQQ